MARAPALQVARRGSSAVRSVSAAWPGYLARNDVSQQPLQAAQVIGHFSFSPVESLLFMGIAPARAGIVPAVDFARREGDYVLKLNRERQSSGRNRCAGCSDSP
jgi:hypothetical protein